MRLGLSMLVLPIALGGVLAVAGCTKEVEAPTDTGVCWHSVLQKDGTYTFNVLAKNQPKIENCASNLEAMRLRFMGLGGNRDTLTGAYQGQFIWLEKDGIYVSQSEKSSRYLLLVRTNDGNLTQPGAAPMPSQ
jgi:hypothetical protein